MIKSQKESIVELEENIKSHLVEIKKVNVHMYRIIMDIYIYIYIQCTCIYIVYIVMS